MMKAALFCLAMCAAVAPKASAQMTWTDKAFVNVTGGLQNGAHTIETASSFPIYEETATVSSSQRVTGGGYFDISGGYKVWRNLAIGVGYSWTDSKGDASITASVPDPLFFDRPRTVNASAAALNHTENTIHLTAVWMIPVTDKIDVAIGVGPAIFSVKQELPGTLTITEPGPTVTSVAITQEKKTAGGVDIGLDATYMINKRFGAGAMARYSTGSVKLDGATEKLTVGGFQIGIGARMRF